jgi:WXXGXW repeat (2 copies)
MIRAVRPFAEEMLMTSNPKALIATLLVAASAIALPAISTAGVLIDVDIAPPAALVEVVPPPRVGYVWAPGFWEWRDGRHVWVGGHWIGERRGYHWVPDHWDPVGGRWHHERGHWER